MFPAVYTSAQTFQHIDSFASLYITLCVLTFLLWICLFDDLLNIEEAFQRRKQSSQSLELY